MTYPVITFCGSMRYFDEMVEVAHRFTAQGWIVLLPFVTNGYGKGSYATEQDFDEMLDDMHKRKIDMSTAVLVYGEHIGESVTSEIEYTKSRAIAMFRQVKLTDKIWEWDSK